MNLVVLVNLVNLVILLKLVIVLVWCGDCVGDSEKSGNSGK